MGCWWGDTARVLGDWGLRIDCDEEVVGREEVVYVDEESVIFGCWLLIRYSDLLCRLSRV